jgi:hypothetical protein
MNEEPDVFTVLQLVAAKHRERIMQMANVTGVGVGYKKVRGVTTNIPAIIVYVSKKVPVSQLALKDIVPPTLDGYPTDVIEATFIALSQPRTSKIRPAVGGISVGHYQITAGTITDIMTDYLNKIKVVVSNNHVLANCAPFGTAQKGDPVYQPGPYDGGTSQDTIALLERWVPLKLTDNLVDGALATPLAQSDVSPNHYDFGAVNGPYKKPKVGMVCQKGGRTTGLTTGVVDAIGATIDVNFGRYGYLRFTNQVVVASSEVFVLGGDSGSLTVEKDSKKPIGVLFAGSSNGLRAVLNDFSIFSDMLDVGYLPVVSGRIVDKETMKPVAGALVEIPEYEFKSITDDTGTFLFGNLAYGAKLTLKAFHPQYKEVTIDFVADQDYRDFGDIALEKLPPPPPALSQILTDAATYITALAIFNYVVAPELISSVKKWMGELLGP